MVSPIPRMTENSTNPYRRKEEDVHYLSIRQDAVRNSQSEKLCFSFASPLTFHYLCTKFLEKLNEDI